MRASGRSKSGAWADMSSKGNALVENVKAGRVDLADVQAECDQLEHVDLQDAFKERQSLMKVRWRFYVAAGLLLAYAISKLKWYPCRMASDASCTNLVLQDGSLCADCKYYWQ